MTDARPHGLYELVDARHGPMLANPNDIYIGRALIRYGEYSEIEWQFLSQFVRSGATVVEVGANIGTHTVPFARAVGPNGRVFAYEPQPVIFQNLCANLALSGLTTVRASQAGCGAEASTVHVPGIRYDVEGNFGAFELSMGVQEGQGVPVPVIRLDDHLPDGPIHLLKIDAEGMEEEIIAGAEESIRRTRPVIYAEGDRYWQTPTLIRRLQRLGYRMWWHTPPLFNPGNWRGIDENDYGRTVSLNLVAIRDDVTVNAIGLNEVTDPDAHPMKAQMVAAGIGPGAEPK